MKDIWEIVLEYRGWRKTYVTRFPGHRVGDIMNVWSHEFVPGTDASIKCVIVSVVTHQEI